MRPEKLRSNGIARAKGLANQRLGRRGEARFASWCEDNGLLPQKSDPDQLGWDYIVELEPEIDNSAPLDREIGLKKVLVQIKSTNTPSKDVRVSLLVLKLLVDSDLPALITRIDFSKGLSPNSAHLLHIGEMQIPEILKAIRQAEKKGRTDLHKIELKLSLAEASPIVANGANLPTLFKEHIPSCGAAYIENKARLRRSCGWDANSIITNFTFASGQGSEALVDLLIGITPELELSSAVIDKRRFGISLDKDIDRLSRGRLKVEVKPHHTARAVVSSSSLGAKRAEIDVDVYTPSMPDLPLEIRKVRAADQFLDVTMHFGAKKGEMTFYIDPDKKFSLHSLAGALCFGVALSDSQAKLEIDFGKFGSQTLDIPAEAKVFSQWELLCEFAETLSSALFRYKRTSDCFVTIHDLRRYLEDNKNMFSILSRLGFALTFELDEECPVPHPRNGAIISPVCIEFASYVYVAIVKAEVSEFSIEEGSMKFVGQQPIVLEDMVLDEHRLDLEAINQRTSELAKRESANSRCIVSTTLNT